MPIKNALAEHDKVIGQRLRLARSRRGVSMETLAAKIAERLTEITGNPEMFTFQQLQKYENGANRIAVSTLLLIADILETPVSFFTDGMSKWTAQDIEHFSIPDLGTQTLKAMRALEKLPEKTVAKFIGLLETMVREMEEEPK